MAPVLATGLAFCAPRDGRLAPAIANCLDIVGFEGIELEAPHGCDDLAEVLALITDQRVPVVSVAAPFHAGRETATRDRLASLSSAHDVTRAQARRELHNAIAAAAKLKVGLVHLSGGWLAEDASKEGAVETLCRELHRVAADHRGLRLALRIEPDANALLDSETLRWVLDDLRKFELGMVYDTASLWIRHLEQRDDVGVWEDRYGGEVLAVHVSDAAEGHPGLPLGAGTVPSEHWRTALRRGGPTVLKLSGVTPRHVVKECARALREEMGLGS